MTRIRRPQLSYANVMSTVAVFIALGGTSYAVARNSIGNAAAQRQRGDLGEGQGPLAAHERPGAQRPHRLRAARAAWRARPGGRPAAPPGGGPPEPWQSLSLAAGLGQLRLAVTTAPAFAATSAGRVYLRGLVTRTDGLPPDDSSIGTLPAGYRPPKRLIFVALGNVRRGAHRRPAQRPGASGCPAPPSEKDYTSLDTVSFWPG